jgi:hypothetical protein
MTLTRIRFNRLQPLAVLRRARAGVDAVRHAGDRRGRLAEEHHLPALHQKLKTNSVVLAGNNCHFFINQFSF